MKCLFAIGCAFALSVAAAPSAYAQKAGGVRSVPTGTFASGQPRVIPSPGRGGGQYRVAGDTRTPNRCTRRQCHWHPPH
jgi:hypothetical protein